MRKINSYDDLMVEKSRLASQLQAQKIELGAELEAIRERFEPVERILSRFGIIKEGKAGYRPTSKESTAGTLLRMGANAGIDVVGQKLLSRVGWFARIVVPLLLRGLSTALVEKIAKKPREGPRNGQNALSVADH